MTEYHNPNQEPGTERRLLMVFALMFLLLLVFQPLLTKYFKKSEPVHPAPAPSATPTPAAPTASAAPAATLPAGAKEATSESEIVVENDLYRIVFTNKGAQVKSWVLKKYDDDKGRPLELVNTTAKVETQQNGQTGYQPAVERYGYPMSLWTYDDTLRSKLNSVLYIPSATGHVEAPADLSFEYSDGNTVVQKTYHFGHSYVVGIHVEVVNNGQTVQAYPAWPAGIGDQITPANYALARVDYAYGDKVTRTQAKKVSAGSTVRGPFNWAGAVDQYFGAVFLPDKPDDAAMVTLSHAALIPKDPAKPNPNETTGVTVLGAAVGDTSGPTTGRWFVGPKAVNVIDSIKSTPAASQTAGPTLGGMVDFGFFGWVGKPLFLWLKWTEQYVRNWGWAICVLTVIINLAVLPLRITSMKSALKMQKVQPLINDIKKKYEKIPRTDPRKAEMNREISGVFKEHGVNPAGGCLPMVIQLPFLWAFYTMLSAAIELRHANWLWIRDLSAPDPYHILPILIIGSTWGMQKMTPTPGMDPAQSRMMNLMMPIMLGFISWSVAAGLGLYWLLGTIIAIGTQLTLNRTALGQEMQMIQQKRARRKASHADRR